MPRRAPRPHIKLAGLAAARPDPFMPLAEATKALGITLREAMGLIRDGKLFALGEGPGIEILKADVDRLLATATTPA